MKRDSDHTCVSQEENRTSVAAAAGPGEGSGSSSSQTKLEGKQESSDGSVFNSRMVEDALRALIESIRHRSGILNIYNNKAPMSGPNEDPDIR